MVGGPPSQGKRAEMASSACGLADAYRTGGGPLISVERYDKRGGTVKITTIGGVLALIPALFGVAHAQDYPTRPVTFVVPYPAGGGLDVLARSIAQKLSERLGKPFVVENRAGAGT